MANEKVTDSATFAKGTLPTKDISYVVINVTIEVKHSNVLKDVYSGQPIQLEPVKSCFKPVDSEQWKGAYAVSSIEFGGTEPFGQY